MISWYNEINFISYSKRHNKFLFPALAGAIYGSTGKAENEISNVVNYNKIRKMESTSANNLQMCFPEYRENRKLKTISDEVLG